MSRGARPRIRRWSASKGRAVAPRRTLTWRARSWRNTVCSRRASSVSWPRRPRASAEPGFREEDVDACFLALGVGLLIQAFKGIAVFVQTRHWNLRRFVETGGMPSSHAASVATLSTEVAFRQGVTSLLFGVTLYFSLVVMYDAAGLRRAAG